MKKTKILSALLSLIMVSSSVIMSGCGNNTRTANNETSASATATTRKTVTLNMFIKTNDSTDPEVAKQVQMAINEITVPKYKTTVKINYLKDADYWAAIDDMEQQVIERDKELEAIAKEAAAAEKAKYDGMTAAEKRKAQKEEQRRKKEEEKNSAATEEELAAEFSELIDDIYEAEDIILESPQIDIFFADSADKLFELVKDGRVAPLNSYLDYESKLLKSYIYPTFLATAKIDGKYYGIPANGNVGGEYEYFVYDKALLDKYGYKVSDLEEIREMKDYLATIKQNEPGVVPLTKETTLSGWEFFGDKETGALGVYKRDTSTTWSSDLHPVFDDVTYYLRHNEAVQEYRSKGYIGNSNGGRFAIDVRVSDTRPPEEFEENGRTYLTYIYKLPRARIENVLTTSWVVSSYSKNKDRAMEIITLFNTNSTLANLLHYGIANENYYYDKDTDLVEILNDKYSMDHSYTGNRYIKYITAEDKDFVPTAKAKNIDSVPYAFIAFRPELDPEQQEIMRLADEVAAKYIKLMNNNSMSVAEAFEKGKAEMDAIEGFAKTAATIASAYKKYVDNVASAYATPPIVLERIAQNKQESMREEKAVEEEPSEVTEEQNAGAEVVEGEAVAEVEAE